jgi:hypothetical protein
MNTPLNPGWLRPEDVAAQIGLSPVYVRAHSRRNNPKSPVLKSTMIGGRYRYLQSDVDAFISENSKKA